MIEGALLTTLSGGLTGLIGTIWSSYNNRKLKNLEILEKEKERAHEISLIKAETEAMKSEAEAQIKITGAKIAGQTELAEIEGFKISQGQGSSKIFQSVFMEELFQVKGKLGFIAVPFGIILIFIFGLSDSLKEMARPLITAYLLGISTWITIKSWVLLTGLDIAALNPETAARILSDNINIVLYLTVTSVTWWFGDRMASKGLAGKLRLGGK